MSKLLAILLVLAVGAAAGRSLQASDPGPRQPECMNILTDSWSHDHIECHLKCDGNPQLKCSLHGGIIRNPFVSCEIDSSILSSAINFDCPVTGSSTGNVACDWGMVQGKVSGCDYPPTKRILMAWTPS